MEFILFTILLFAWISTTAWSAAHILLNKRDPRGAALWLVIVGLLPLTGPFLYWSLGINRLRHSKAVRVRRRQSPGGWALPPVTYADLSTLGGGGVRSLASLAGRITRRPVLSGNSVEALYEGNQVFPAMLTAIGAAKHSVNLSTYILDRDAVGKRVISALCSAAERGVQVRVLVDGVGTSRSAVTMARRLRSSGARLSVFHPLFGLWFRRPSFNMRNHRKLVIVDGAVGFTGGINISSRHLFSRWKAIEPVRDIHFRIGGGVVVAMQETFAEDWQASTGELLNDEMFFPPVGPAGDASVRAVVSGPDEDLEKIYQLILGALRSAREKITIMTPYFIPDRALIQGMDSAVLAGVEVRLLLPEVSDHPLVQRASTAHLPELLNAGVKVLLLPPPFVHSKLMIVDGEWSLIGSANLDPRSFRLNFEFDLEVYDIPFARELLNYTDKLAENARTLTREDLRARPLATRLIEGAAKVFSPYL
ncbi:MAG: cardiolipin synthase [bacterium]|nr:cardiolipin synthase [bacterium]